ncbi:dimethylaniline monooxygenase [Apiospora saccharicola]
MDKYDLLIIGAGWHGLAMAKTYLHCDPACDLLIIDSANTLGGVWARERLYPGLKTNNVVGSYEFSDFPLDPAHYGIKPSDHIPGPVVHQYLVDFATRSDLHRRLRLQSEVQAVTMTSGELWRIEYRGTIPDQRNTINARKVVVATGLTSEPNMPQLVQQHNFRGDIFHAKSLPTHAHGFNAATKDIVVIGANKSAMDACYLAAQRSAPSARVHMLIRPSGRGPSWMWRRQGLTNFLSISRLASTRLFSWFNPNPLASETQRLFQRSWIGVLICGLFWTLLDLCVLVSSQYIAPGSRTSLRPLRPRYSTFWMGNSLTVHNYDSDWFELALEDKIRVHHADIEGFGEDGDTVCLTSGLEIVHVGIVVACTGWKTKSNIVFDPPPVLESVDLKEEALTRRAGSWSNSELISHAKEKLHFEYPKLIFSGRRNQSKYPKDPQRRLYRHMVPLHLCAQQQHNNLAFIGFPQSVLTGLVAQAQALWITAWMQGRLRTPPKDARSRSEWAHLQAEYHRMRHLGSAFPDLALDSIPYIDLQLGDLGLSSKRKKGWLKELLGQYGPQDYKGIVDAWLKVRDNITELI